MDSAAAHIEGGVEATTGSGPSTALGASASIRAKSGTGFCHGSTGNLTVVTDGSTAAATSASQIFVSCCVAPGAKVT